MHLPCSLQVKHLTFLVHHQTLHFPRLFRVRRPFPHQTYPLIPRRRRTRLLTLFPHTCHPLHHRCLRIDRAAVHPCILLNHDRPHKPIHQTRKSTCRRINRKVRLGLTMPNKALSARNIQTNMNQSDEIKVHATMNCKKLLTQRS